MTYPPLVHWAAAPILVPTKAAVSTAYFRVRMLHALNPNSFQRGYGHFVISKASFMISEASFILTLIVSISIFCK